MHRRRGLVGTALILTALVAALLALANAAPGRASAQQSHAVPRGRTPGSTPGMPAIIYGSEGGSIVPFTVTIQTDGAVVVERLGHKTMASSRLSPDALAGLHTLAVAEHFFTLPNRMEKFGNPDVSGRFIGVQGTTGVKTVHVRFVRVASFDQLYAVLMAVAPPTGNRMT